MLVLPGFGATDRATGRLRAHLDQRGWMTYAWGVGPNHGLTDEVLDGVLRRFDEVYAVERQPVDVVGWSFGGLLARWVAHQRPTQVRSVVTMGSPWRPEGERTRTTPLFERARRTHGLSERAEKVVDELRGPLPVPTTAIWSKTDGIVGWRGCRGRGVRERPQRRGAEQPPRHGQQPVRAGRPGRAPWSMSDERSRSWRTSSMRDPGLVARCCRSCGWS